MGDAGSKKMKGVSLDCKESSEVHRPAWAQQSHAQVRKRADQLAKKGSQAVSETPPVGESQSNGMIERAAGLVGRPGQNTEGCARASHWDQSPARRKDTVLPGGICCVPDEQVRHRQRRKDTATEAARPMGQHTHPGIRREDSVFASQASKRRKVGTAIPSRSVRGGAELVVGGSSCHRARNSDQDTLSERQENP